MKNKISIVKKIVLIFFTTGITCSYGQKLKPVNPILKTAPTINPVVIKPGTVQPASNTNISTQFVKTNKDVLAEAKNDMANAKPIEILGNELGGGKEMQLNQVLKQYIYNSRDKYATLALTRHNLELRDPNDKVVWSTNLNTSDVNKLVMQADGNLVVKSNSGAELWSSRTKGGPHAKLIIREFKTLGLEFEVIDSTKTYQYYWSSLFKNKPWAFANKGKSLCANQSLRLRTDSVESLQGPNYVSFLFEPVNDPDQIFTSTSALTVTNTVNRVSTITWIQNIPATENAIAIMKPDGNFGVYTDINHLNNPLWETKTEGYSGACLVMPDTGKNDVIIINRNGQTIWTPKAGPSNFKTCEASVTLKTGSDDKVARSEFRVIIYPDANIDINQQLPVMQDGKYSNWANCGTDIEYAPGSINTVKIDKTFSSSKNIKDQSLKNFEQKGGRIEIYFEPADIVFGRDHWTIDNFELNLNYKDQFGSSVVKVIRFANTDASKPLVKLGQELLIGSDASAVICSFDKNFNPVDYKIYTVINGNAQIKTYKY